MRAVADKLGRIIVLSGVPRKLWVFSYRGEPLGDFPFPGFEGAEQAVPTALTIDHAGHLYIADGTSGLILVYDPEWRLRLRFGGRSQGPGGLRSVTAMTVDAAGRILVADAQHTPAIQVFDAGGTYLRGWGEHTAGPMGVSLPIGIAVDTAGRILVADTIRQTITVFGSEGEFLFRFGGLGTAPGSLGFPGGLDADQAGRLYVTEAGNARLQIFEMAAAVPGERQRMPTAPPAREREEIRRGLGEALQGIAK
jgi:DNA-binding beta-propeller fold protein YncE